MPFCRANSLQGLIGGPESSVKSLLAVSSEGLCPETSVYASLKFHFRITNSQFPNYARLFSSPNESFTLVVLVYLLFGYPLGVNDYCTFFLNGRFVNLHFWFIPIRLLV